MKKINTAVGALILLGFVLFMGGMVLKVSGLSLLSPAIQTTAGYFISANSCLLVALIVDHFDQPA